MMYSSQQNALAAQEAQDPQAQGNDTPIIDTVYLKDGSIIHGKIIEETPETSLKIQTLSGNVFTYKMSDVEKITHQRGDEGGQ